MKSSSHTKSERLIATSVKAKKAFRGREPVGFSTAAHDARVARKILPSRKIAGKWVIEKEKQFSKKTMKEGPEALMQAAQAALNATGGVKKTTYKKVSDALKRKVAEAHVAAATRPGLQPYNAETSLVIINGAPFGLLDSISMTRTGITLTRALLSGKMSLEESIAASGPCIRVEVLLRDADDQPLRQIVYIGAKMDHAAINFGSGSTLVLESVHLTAIKRLDYTMTPVRGLGHQENEQ
jgi:hypothetical protein